MRPKLENQKGKKNLENNEIKIGKKTKFTQSNDLKIKD